jgi:enamine deaminase RidA (YjgF/YER057c/UK114 family)
MSQAVLHAGFAFLAGQVADDPSRDVKGQTEQILAKIDRLLAQVGSDKTRILSASIWLADYKTFNEMNEVWDAWVPEGDAPARACVESKLAFPQYTVEIGVIAAV